MAQYRSPAISAYVRRLALFMVAYLVVLFAVGYAFRHAAPHGPLAWGVAALPALPIIGVFWAIGRLMIEEADEYVRMLFVRQSLFATGFCLSVMTVWEFLQNYEVVPPGNGGFGAAFVWFVGLGFGALVNRFTMGSAGPCA